MNMKKRPLALVTCAAMLLPLGLFSACKGEEEPVKSKPTNVYRYETLYENTIDYNASGEESFTGRVDLNSLQGVGNRVILTGYQYDADWNSSDVFWDMDTATGETADINVPAVDNTNNEWRNYTKFAEDGTVWYTVNAGFYDEASQTYVENMSLYHADSAGNVIASADLYELFGITDRANTYLYVNDLAVIGDSVILATESAGLNILSSDLTEVKKIEIADLSYVYRILPHSDKLLICYYTDPDYKQVVVNYDITTGMMSAPISISSAAANNLYGAMPSDAYDFVYSTTIGIYGYDIASNTETELLNWINSDINATYLRDTYIAPDGTVYTLMMDYGSSKQTTTVNRLTRIPDEEVKEKYMLTYGTLYTSSEIIDAIVKFNRKSEDYRITVRDYSGYNSEENEWTGALTQFNNDIISGNIPDIIQLNAEMPYANYAAKGLFADLYPLLDADTTIDRADLYENILDALSVNGKLYRITPSFRVSTLVGKSAVVGDNDGWTMDELLAAMETMEDGSTDPFAGEVTRETFLTNVCTMARDQFIDKDTGSCSFDSAEFIKILEFAAQLPEKTVWETVNWDEVGENFYVDRELMYRNGTALLYQMSLGNYTSFWETQQGLFGEEISFVGYPNENRTGSAIMLTQSFAISAQSKCPEGAWAFLSEYLNLQKETEGDSLYRFSIFRSVNEKMAEYALAYHDNYWYEKEYGTDAGSSDVAIAVPAVEVAVEEVPKAVTGGSASSGVSGEMDADGDGKTWSYWLWNDTIDLGMMTEDAVAHIDALLESLSQVYQSDDSMLDIILEEASAYFSGVKSAEEAAGLIQNRVFIYVNESR
ncbi:MAG: extracellular solute-binding protein [Clostridia bacterium]|nr:extracellular solute-binding protein [Clostridia bacterium]